MSKINEFVEHQKLKVLILCDEEKINDSKYFEYKEKVVLHTNHLERSPDEIADICFKKEWPLSDCNQIKNFKEHFIFIVGQLKTNNIRTLLHGLNCFKTIVTQVNNTNIEFKDNIILADLLFPSLAYAVGYKDYSVELHKLQQSVTELSSMSYAYHLSKEKNKTEELSNWEKFFEEVLSKFSKNIDFKSVFELVCKGHLSEELINDDIKRWDTIKRGNDYPVTSFDHTTSVTDEEFELIVKNAIEILDNENYVFPTTAALFRFCVNFELFYSSGATSLEKGFLDKLRKFALSVCSNCAEHTEVDAFGRTGDESSFISDLRSSLTDLTENIIQEEQRVKSQVRLLELFKAKNLPELEKHLRNETETEFFTEPFVRHLIVEIEKAEAALLRVLGIFIQKRYAQGYYFEKFKEELPAICYLQKSMQGIIAKKGNCLSSMMLGNLINTIEKVIKSDN